MNNIPSFLFDAISVGLQVHQNHLSNFFTRCKESNFGLDGYWVDTPELNILLVMDVDEYPTIDIALELDPATR